MVAPSPALTYVGGTPKEVLDIYFHVVISFSKPAGGTPAAPGFCGSFFYGFDGFAPTAFRI